MKKILIISLACVLAFTTTACSLFKKTDAVKFKEEYESLNGEKSKKTGKINRSVNISKDNVFVYKKASDIVDAINNKETFAVYFGFSECPWCRSVISTLSEVATDIGIDEIYYVDVSDIRDELEVKNGKVVTKKEGDKSYMGLLKLLDNVLDDYTLTDDSDKEISTSEKRIYAPNVVSVVAGKAIKKDTGISDKQTNPYMKLTAKMKKETYNKFKCVLDCIVETNNTCTKEKC